MMGSYLGRNKSPAEHVKQHVKYELSTLLCNTIVTTVFTGPERRLIALQKQKSCRYLFVFDNVCNKSSYKFCDAGVMIF